MKGLREGSMGWDRPVECTRPEVLRKEVNHRGHRGHREEKAKENTVLKTRKSGFSALRNVLFSAFLLCALCG
jgi:hypothetical protein